MATKVRYAPEDPTLPKPWKGLVDGKTGYLYFWNPETNATQYEKPTASSSPPALSKSASVPLSSSIQVHQSSHGHQQHDCIDKNVGYSEGVSAGQNQQGPNSQALRFARALGPSVGGVSSVESYRRQHEITTMGNNVPPPLISFESTDFPPEILREVRQAGFTAPTPIQAQSWPIALQNRDIVAVAKTGSGKTLGYLIPGFIHLKRCHNNSRMGPTVLVLSPTRELATQIQDEAVKFGRSSRISCTCLYGGAQKGPQLRDLERGVDIVVATPGRLNDILEMRRISLHQVSYLVLDEADRMLDMGFEPQIRKIVKEIPSRRQTLMYTATWPKEVRKIAADLLVNPVQVNIGNINELVANKSITQYVEVVTPMGKHKRLEQILRSQEPGSKVIIFCSTKKMCDRLAGNMAQQFGAAAIHGDKSQSEREYVLNQFRTGKSPVLVATDVAARGLDIKDIRVVINYDFPTGIEDYVHRIGRTGRAGATGIAYTFFCDQDAKHATDLIKVLEGANQRVPVEIRDIAAQGRGTNRDCRKWSSSGSGYPHREQAGWSISTFSGSSSHGFPMSSVRYGQGYHDGHNEDSHGRYDAGYRAKNSNYQAGEMGELCAHSGSQSPNRGRSVNNSQSMSPSRSWNHDRSRSRSRSCSPDRYGTASQGQGHLSVSRDASQTMHERSQSPAEWKEENQKGPWDSPEQRGTSYGGDDEFVQSLACCEKDEERMIPDNGGGAT